MRTAMANEIKMKTCRKDEKRGEGRADVRQNKRIH